MSTPVIRGQNGVHIHHTSGKVVVAETLQKTIVKQGLYADLLAAMPKKGDMFDGVRVTTAELSPAKGGMGFLTVTGLFKRGSGGESGESDDATVYEVEMAQLEKPILCHPSFEAYAGQVDAWRNSDPTLRAAMKYEDADGVFDLNGMALKAAELIRKGVESYLVFSPVCRRTTRVSDSAENEWSDVGEDCGKRCDPPAECIKMVAGSWAWLKTADRAVETTGGGAERVEEWTGADEWDEDLYPEA